MDIDKFYDFFEKCEEGEVDALRAEVARLNELFESTKAQLRCEQDERDKRETHSELGPIERWGDVDWKYIEALAIRSSYAFKSLAKAIIKFRDMYGRRIQRLAVNQEKLAERVAALEDKSKAPTDPEIDEYHRGMSNESLRHIASEATRESMRSMDARDALQLRVAEFVRWVRSQIAQDCISEDGCIKPPTVEVFQALDKLRELGLVKEED